MRTFWENERRKLLGQPLIQDDDNQSNTAIDAPQVAVLAQEEEISFLMTIETYTEEGAFGGTGDKETATLQANLYFMFDFDVLNDLQTQNINPNTALINYVQNFRTSVINVWSTFSYKNIPLNLNQVQFLPLDTTMDANNALHNLFVVGNGGSNFKDDGNQVSYVATGQFNMRNTIPATPINPSRPNTWGYFYYENQANISYAAHEFGHIFGLTDRYHEGVEQVLGPDDPPFQKYNTSNNLTGRVTRSMYLSPSIDPDYRPLDNLYSVNTPTITAMQLEIVFDINKTEKTYPTCVWIHQIRTDIQDLVIGVSKDGAHIYESNDGRTWYSTQKTLHYYGGKGRLIIPSSPYAKNLLHGIGGRTTSPTRADSNKDAILKRRN